MTIPDSSSKDLDGLIADALRHLESLGYASGTLRNYSNVWAAFLRFAREEAAAEEELSTDLVQRFLKNYGIPEAGTDPLSFYQGHVRNVIRVLTEFALHGCFHRRAHVVEKTKLPSALKSVLDGYEKFTLIQLRSAPATLRARKQHIVRFLRYLDAHGGTSASDIRASMLSGFVMSQAPLKPATLAIAVSSLRSFLRYLCMEGKLPGDLSLHVPKVRVGRDARIPSVWRQGDVDTLLATVDRRSPVGKRDYAILLLAARLGMRASDIRAIELDHLHWDQGRIEMMQTKGGAPLALPLTEEIGSALIDYLKNVGVSHPRPAEHVLKTS